MTKFVSSLIVCGVLSVSSLSATELNHEQYEQDVAPSVPSVLFGYEPQTQDLLSVASNGALTEQSAGIYALSALEMQEVRGGGKFKKLWKKYNGRILEGTLKGVAAGIGTGITGGLGAGLGAGAAHGVVNTILSKR